MFLIKAGTTILIEQPSKNGCFYWNPWRPYETKEDKIYNKEEVWDFVAVCNGRDIPEWAVQNITEHNYIVINRAGKFAMVRPTDAEYLD